MLTKRRLIQVETSSEPRSEFMSIINFAKTERVRLNLFNIALYFVINEKLK